MVREEVSFFTTYENILAKKDVAWKSAEYFALFCFVSKNRARAHLECLSATTKCEVRFYIIRLLIEILLKLNF